MVTGLLSSQCTSRGIGHGMCHKLWQADFTRNRKQAQNPPGSLHTTVSPVEWSSLKGRGPQWFTVRKTTCFTKKPLVTACGHVISLGYCFLFSGLFSILLLYVSFVLLSLMAFSLAFLYQVLFHGLCYSFSRVPFSSWVLVLGAVSWASPVEFLIS